MTKNQKILSWIAQIAAAAILIQTLYFKFSAAPESVYIFSTLGAEPLGRLGSGVIEAVAALLLFMPKRAWIGAGLASLTMLGAIGSHLTVLGIEIQGDGGLLFGLACTVLLCSLVVLWLRFPRHLLPKGLGRSEVRHVA
ncbi:MAG: DoxX family protein [Acidobacteria bacterium]|nr:DoxX family protein [Acidobacteriota bacterium]MCB9398474.1 DoxX family protein [Acidobacteriota bacterium]